MEMEAWLTQLEMEMDKDPVIENPCGGGGMQRAASDEELAIAAGALVAGDHFSYDPFSVSPESNASSELDLDYDALLHLQSFSDIDNPPSTSHIFTNSNHLLSANYHPISSNHVRQSPSLQDGKSNTNDNSLPLQTTYGPSVVADDILNNGGNQDHGNSNKPQQAGGKSTKRKREPSQVQDHIMAERKRRELLSTQFIALSAIVPGLKKTDKTSVMGEAIKYMKQLQDKVKELEEVTAKRTVNSVVVVKKSRLVVADDDNNDASSSVDDSYSGDGGGGGANGGTESLPEIEVKMSDNSMLIKIYCEKHRGILAKLFQVVESFDMNVTNCSVVPFGTLVLDITILAQFDNQLNANVKDVVRSLRLAAAHPAC